MSAEHPRPEGGRPGPRAERSVALAGRLGVELPPFKGPLVAFQLDDHQGATDPVFLGGDLQAIHREAGVLFHRWGHDPSLDNAIVTLTDHETKPIEVPAVEGIWGTCIAAERLPAAPYFSLTDSEGRIRAWLLLPPPRLMVGIAHLWLPSVPPSVDPRERADHLCDG